MTLIDNKSSKSHIIINLANLRIKLQKKVLENFYNLFINTFNHKYPYTASICIIIKNEASYIKEWIEYHRLIGFEKFYIYDNESTDNILDVLKPYIEKNIVDYIFFPGKCVQREAYENAVEKAKKETKWLAIIDADEFIVPIEDNNINDFLDKYKHCAGIGINWLNFDSNGHEKRPLGLCIENYTNVRNFEDLSDHHIKSIVNPRLVLKSDVHSCKFIYKFNMRDVNKKIICKKDFPKNSLLGNYNNIKNCLTLDTNIDKIRINHYFTRSKEEYINKINRGRADITEMRKFEDEICNFKNGKEDKAIFKYLNKLKEILEEDK